MKTKKEKIALAKNMLEALGLTPQDLLEDSTLDDSSRFLDIIKINGIPCMFICYNEEKQKGEWLCLEIPDKPMTWDDGLRWCQSQGGCYGEIPILRFILEQRNEINKVLEANGYPLVEKDWYWSDKTSRDCLLVLGASAYGTRYCNKKKCNGVRAVKFF